MVLFFSAHVAALSILDLPVAPPVEAGLLARIAAVLFSITRLLALMSTSTCFVCRLVSSGTNSSVAYAISSAS